MTDIMIAPHGKHYDVDFRCCGALSVVNLSAARAMEVKEAHVCKPRAIVECFWCGTEYPFGGHCPRRLDGRKDYHRPPTPDRGRFTHGVNWME